MFLEEEVVDVLGWPAGGVLGDPVETWEALRQAGLRIVWSVRDRDLRETGVSWPPHAETMIGPARLKNVQDLVTRVLADDIPGDLVETGVWRGGVIILMRAILAAYGDTERQVWACDSFEGLPDPDVDRYPADVEFAFADSMERDFTKQVLVVPLDRVKANLARYELLDDRVLFLKGWFKDTLPSAPIEQIGVLRVDGDLYEWTIDVSFTWSRRCRREDSLSLTTTTGSMLVEAVDNYRATHSIVDQINEIDWTGVWWQRSPR